MRTIALVVGSIVAALAISVLSLRSGLWNPSYRAMVAKYAAPPSTFRTVNGVTVHLRDEGQGPVIVMVHSSMSDLHIWDRVAEQLTPRYRVVRFDWPPYGLSVDPSETYSMERAVALLAGVVDALDLQQFVLVGSSSGATLSTIYAAQHPERVTALALSAMPLALPPDGKTDWRVDALVWAQRRFFPDYMPRFFYDISLAHLVGDVRNLREQDIAWYYETNNVPRRFRGIQSYLAANMKSLWRTGAGDSAGKIVKPILLQWGDSDPVLPAYLGDKVKADLAQADVTILHYLNVGHYPMLEIPEQMGADILRWLAQRK